MEARTHQGRISTTDVTFDVDAAAEANGKRFDYADHSSQARRSLLQWKNIQDNDLRVFGARAHLQLRHPTFTAGSYPKPRAALHRRSVQQQQQLRDILTDRAHIRCLRTQLWKELSGSATQISRCTPGDFYGLYVMTKKHNAGT